MGRSALTRGAAGKGVAVEPPGPYPHIQGQAGRDHVLSRRREFVLSRIPEIPFEVQKLERLPGSEGPDLLRVRGRGPVLIHRLRLRGTEAACRSLDLETWVAEIPVGPEGGEASLEALDFGGEEVARARVAIPARS